MQPYTIKISVKAKRNILNIKYYIKYNLLSSQASEKFETDFFRKLDKIAKEPHLYEKEFFGKHLYHKAVVGKYIIAFRIDEQAHTVHIVAIGHSLQKRRNIVKGRK